MLFICLLQFTWAISSDSSVKHKQDSMAFYRHCDDNDAACICMCIPYTSEICCILKWKNKNWFEPWLHACRMVCTYHLHAQWYDDAKTNSIKKTHAHKFQQKDSLHAALVRNLRPRPKHIDSIITARKSSTQRQHVSNKDLMTMTAAFETWGFFMFCKQFFLSF